MATVETIRPALPQHYLWWFPGSPLKVRLALRVVQRLSHRFTTMGSSDLEEGLLFGETWGGATEVQDFQPSASISVRNMVAGMASERKRSLVGYYRVERGDSFRLKEQDLVLARDCFASPYSVFLIIHRNSFGPPTATFFFYDGECRMADFAFLEFPFDPSLLAAEQTDRMQRSQQAIEPPAVAPLPAPPEPASKAERDPMRGRKIFAWTCVLASIGAIGGMFRNDIWHAVAAAAAPSLPATATAPRQSISLRAVRRNGDLELTWNRDSALITSASTGALSIQDGDSKRLVSLDPAQLKDGSILYAPISDQVVMQLTLAGPTNSFTESITVILPAVATP